MLSCHRVNIDCPRLAPMAKDERRRDDPRHRTFAALASLPILLVLPGCGIGLPRSHGTPAGDIDFDIVKMVVAGGEVYADAIEFDVVDEIYDAHRLVILDPT